MRLLNTSEQNIISGGLVRNETISFSEPNATNQIEVEMYIYVRGDADELDKLFSE